MATARALDSFTSVSTPREGKKPISFPTAGRLGTLRRIGGLLLAAILCLLTGKPPLQTLQEDPLDRVVTQNDEDVESNVARYQKREELRREEIEAPPPPREEVRRQEAPPAPAHNALLDTTQRWDRRKLYRESDGISGKPAAIPFSSWGDLRCVSEIDSRRPRIQAEPPKIISQEDLTELEILGKRFREAKKRYAKKRDGIRRAMESGASVEAGFRSAAMTKRDVLVVR
jgi:hypothetical protein